MNQPNLRKFRADFGDFKFFCTIEDTAFYLFERVASDLARQYAKKLFGRQGNIATSNLVILTAAINGDELTGTAIDGDIKVLFSAGASEIYQRLFVPEANLVVSGKFRLGRDVCTVGIAIANCRWNA